MDLKSVQNPPPVMYSPSYNSVTSIYKVKVNIFIQNGSLQKVYKYKVIDNSDRIIHNLAKIMLRDKIEVTVKWKYAFSLKMKKCVIG